MKDRDALAVLDRVALREALLAAEPWLAEPDVGPRAVDAGTCGRCGAWPRLLPTCGPIEQTALCPRCADALGDDAWCDGHLEDGRLARQWAGALPARWADAVVLWWVATGELRLETVPDLTVSGLDPRVRALLPAP